jgi:hypothetical protein
VTAVAYRAAGSGPAGCVGGVGGFHAPACPQRVAQGGPSPVDRRKPGSKHHLITDAGGIPLVVTITGGHRNDVTQLLPRPREESTGVVMLANSLSWMAIRGAQTGSDSLFPSAHPRESTSRDLKSAAASPRARSPPAATTRPPSATSRKPCKKNHRSAPVSGTTSPRAPRQLSRRNLRRRFPHCCRLSRCSRRLLVAVPACSPRPWCGVRCRCSSRGGRCVRRGPGRGGAGSPWSRVRSPCARTR